MTIAFVTTADLDRPTGAGGSTREIIAAMKAVRPDVTVLNGHPARQLRFYDRLRSFDPDAVICRTNASMVGPAMYCRQSETPFIGWVRGQETDWVRRHHSRPVAAGLRRSIRWIYRQLDHACVAYPEIKTELPDSVPVTVVPNASNEGLFHPDVSPRRLPEKTIIYSGGLAERHCVDQIFKLTNTGSPTVVIGDGPERERVQRVASHNPLLSYCGVVEREKVPNWVAGAEVGFVPFHPDIVSCPVKMYEYEAVGLDILTNDPDRLQYFRDVDDLGLNATWCHRADQLFEVVDRYV